MEKQEEEEEEEEENQENEKRQEEEEEEDAASAGSLPHEPVQGWQQPGGKTRSRRGSQSRGIGKFTKKRNGK